MRKEHKKAFALIIAILAIYEIGCLVAIIEIESKLGFILWVLGQFPVFWICYQIALMAEEEVSNGN